jgi:hypothetical protein
MQREQLKRRSRYSSLLWPALVVLLSACTTGQMGIKTDVEPFESTQLMFSKDASKGPWDGTSSMLNDRARLRIHLEKHADPKDKELKLGKLIDHVKKKNTDAGEDGTPPFQGLGGGYFHTLLAAAKLKATGPGGSYSAFAPADVSLVGRITEYKFERFGTTNEGKGELTVETIQTVENDLGQIEQRKFKWEIEIKNKGYYIHTFNTEDDPFPGTLYFDLVMLERIKDKGYNVKLHANADGINVKKIYVGNAQGDDPILLNGSHPEWQKFKALKKKSDDDCIDMFLALPDENNDGKPDNLDDIPTNYPDLINDYYYAYCLGRCASPAIVNSR